MLSCIGEGQRKSNASRKRLVRTRQKGKTAKHTARKDGEISPGCCGTEREKDFLDADKGSVGKKRTF